MRIRRARRAAALAIWALLPLVALTAQTSPPPALGVRPLEASTPSAASSPASAASSPADDDDAPAASPTPPFGRHGFGTMTPLDPADDANVASAKTWFAHMQSGDIDRSKLTPSMKPLVTDAMVKQIAGHFGHFGTPTIFEAGGKYVRNGVTTYLFRVGWPAGAVFFQFAVDDASGDVAGFFTRPAFMAGK